MLARITIPIGESEPSETERLRFVRKYDRSYTLAKGTLDHGEGETSVVTLPLYTSKTSQAMLARYRDSLLAPRNAPPTASHHHHPCHIAAAAMMQYHAWEDNSPMRLSLYHAISRMTASCG
jgi:hypothetical protein